MMSVPPPHLPANEIEPTAFEAGPHVATGKRALERDSLSLTLLAGSLGEAFERSAALLVACTGRVYVVGDEAVESLGNRLARTLNRSGTVALWINAREAHETHASWASKRDLFLVLSPQAPCEALVQLLPQLADKQVRSIGVFLRAGNLLARRCTEYLYCSGLPAVGTPQPTPQEHHLDALAVALVEAVTVAKNIKCAVFDKQPNSQVLQRLLLKAGDLMRTDEDLSCVSPTSTWSEALHKMQKNALNLVFVVNSATKLVGVIGARELIDMSLLSQDSAAVERVMRKNFPTINVHTPIGEAMSLMKHEQLEALPVESEIGQLIGVLSLHDLML